MNKKKILALVGLFGGAGMLAAFTRREAKPSTLIGGDCTNPLVIGELRNSKNHLCVDIGGLSGKGNIISNFCDGGKDQQIIMCGDGSMRNQALNTCFTRTGDDNMIADYCHLTPTGITSDQKFRKGDIRSFVDAGGRTQTAFELINEQINGCIDISGHDGNGNIGFHGCEKRADQFFYFYNRGKVVDYGRLVNKKSGKCLGIAGYKKTGLTRTHTVACEDRDDQRFRFYENGELVNMKSGHCIDVDAFDGTGNVNTYPCENQVDQMWTNSNFHIGEYFPLLNKKSGQCMDVEGTNGSGNILTYDCEYIDDQYWRFDNEKWVAPTGSWRMVGCNQNGSVKRTVTASTTSTESLTSETSLEVSASVEQDFTFGKASVSTTVSTSIAKSWESSYSQEESFETECLFYDNMKKWKGGCMWQFNMKTSKGPKKIDWNSKILRCSKGTTAPTCPPFTKCANKTCNKCIEL